MSSLVSKHESATGDFMIGNGKDDHMMCDIDHGENPIISFLLQFRDIADKIELFAEYLIKHFPRTFRKSAT